MLQPVFSANLFAGQNFYNWLRFEFGERNSFDDGKNNELY